MGIFSRFSAAMAFKRTISSEREVLIKHGATYKEVKANDLVVGAKALMVHVSEETIAAVRAQPAPHGIVSRGLVRKDAFLFAIDPQRDMAIPVLPEIKWETYVDCWGPSQANTHQIVQQAESNSKFSAPINSDRVLTGRVEFETGHRMAHGLATADVIQTPQSYSCESQCRSYDGTP